MSISLQLKLEFAVTAVPHSEAAFFPWDFRGNELVGLCKRLEEFLLSAPSISGSAGTPLNGHLRKNILGMVFKIHWKLASQFHPLSHRSRKILNLLVHLSKAKIPHLNLLSQDSAKWLNSAMSGTLTFLLHQLNHPLLLRNLCQSIQYRRNHPIRHLLTSE